MTTSYLLDTIIPRYKSVKNGLTYVHGLGFANVKFLIKKLGLSKNYKIFELNSDQINKIKLLIKQSKIYINLDLKRLRYNVSRKINKKKNNQNKKRNNFINILTNVNKSKNNYIR